MLSSRDVAFLLPVFAMLVAAHSWVEQLANIAPNGSFVAEYGYPRGFVDKGAPNFDQNADNWMMPPLQRQPHFINRDDHLCHPSQRVAYQTTNYPRLQTIPGGMIAMRYAENGHATIPEGGRNLMGKPERAGTVFVFGTQQPRQDETLFEVLQWTRDGSGGDGRGHLLSSQNFDDGRCYQLGNGAIAANSRKERTPNPLLEQPGSEHELLCESDVMIPDNVPFKKPYTVYWVWQWPTAPGRDPNDPSGKDEYYTSCIDVDVVQSLRLEKIEYPLVQQDPMPTAVSDFRSRSALTTDPLAIYSASGFGRQSGSSKLRLARHTARSPLRILITASAIALTADSTTMPAPSAPVQP